MLRLGSYVLLELQEPDFMFLVCEPGSNLGDPNFFKRSILENFL